MIKRFLGAIAVAALVAVTAAPAAAQDYNWTGVYIGANGGYGWGNAHSIFPNDSGNFSSFSPFDGGRFGQELSGGVAGGHVGLNQQWGNWVAGLELLVDWSDLSKTSTNVFSTVSPTAKYETSLDWITAITPRAGYAWRNFLFDLKGGLAVGQVDSKLTSTFPLFAQCPCTFHESATHFGWTIGGGVEYAVMKNVILGMEYNYYDFGKKQYGGRAVPDTSWPVQYTIDSSFSTVLARISFKFGGP